MPDLYFGRAWRPKAATLANDALDARVLNELRRPAAIKAFCRHNHATEKCSICMRNHDEQMGRLAQRL
jgi:hypothetical protein